MGRNMVNADELVDQQDYEDILLDIREEVSRTYIAIAQCVLILVN